MNGILAGILGTIGLFLGFAAAPATPFFGNGSGTINQLSPFTVSSNQVRLASTTANFRIPSLTSKDCVGTDSNGVLQEGTCTGGSGGSFPFTATTNYGQVVYATSTPTLWFQSGFFASSTSRLVHATLSAFNSTYGTTTYASSTALTSTSGYFTNLFIGADTIAEYIADTAGAMFTGNTESGITVTYQDSDNTTDFTVAAGVANLTSSDFGDWTCNGSACTLDADSVALGTDTTGNYLATLADSGGGTLTISGSGSETAAVTAGINLGNANTWTGKQNFYGSASSTVLSAHSAFFGATATSSFSTAGVLTLATPLAVTSGGTGASSLSDLITLGTHTTGNYLATLSSSGSITVGGSGSETAAGTVNLNMGNANTWTALQTFANASTTLLSASYASSTAWYGGGLLSDCDTAATSKLLWDTTSGRFSCGTDTGITVYDAFTHPQAGTSATTSGMIFTASSTILNLSSITSTSTNATTTNLAVSTTLSLFGTVYSTLTSLGNALVNAVTAVTPTGTWDFGGATSVEIVNGTAPTVGAIGQIALDTTATQLLVGTSTNASFPAVLPLEQPLFSVTISSTTPEFISSGTIPISRWVEQAREITRFECFVKTGTSKVVNVTDGTNDTETITCATTATSDVDVATNASFSADELWYIEFGATTGSVDYVSFTAYGYVTRQ